MIFRRRDTRREDAQREYRLRVAMGEPATRALRALPSFNTAPEPDPPARLSPRLRLIQGGDAGPRPRRPAIYLYGRGEDPVA